MQSTYLKRMGITEWRLREHPISTVLRPVLWYSKARQGLLIADANNSETQALLQKIAEAIAKDFVAVEEVPDSVSFVINFDDKMKQIFDEKNFKGKIIKAASLNELLQDVALKKQLWIELKATVRER